MTTTTPSRGATELLLIASRYGGIRALARRIAKQSQQGTITRHIGGNRLPVYQWRKIYEERLRIDPDWFEQPATPAQLRRVAKL